MDNVPPAPSHGPALHPEARNPLELVEAGDFSTDEARLVLAQVYEEVGIQADVQRLQRLPGDLRARGGEWWVCLLRDATVGAIGLKSGPGEHEGELCFWGLVKARRGLGLGKWMAERVLRHARERKLHRLTARVTPSMRRAATILRDLGFRGPPGFDPETFDRPTTLTRGGATADAADPGPPDPSNGPGALA